MTNTPLRMVTSQIRRVHGLVGNRSFVFALLAFGSVGILVWHSPSASTSLLETTAASSQSLSDRSSQHSLARLGQDALQAWGEWDGLLPQGLRAKSLANSHHGHSDEVLQSTTRGQQKARRDAVPMSHVLNSNDLRDEQQMLADGSSKHVMERGTGQLGLVTFVPSDGASLRIRGRLADFPPGPATISLRTSAGEETPVQYQAVMPLEGKKKLKLFAPADSLFTSDLTQGTVVSVLPGEAAEHAQKEVGESFWREGMVYWRSEDGTRIRVNLPQYVWAKPPSNFKALLGDGRSSQYAYGSVQGEVGGEEEGEGVLGGVILSAVEGEEFGLEILNGFVFIGEGAGKWEVDWVSWNATVLYVRGPKEAFKPGPWVVTVEPAHGKAPFNVEYDAARAVTVGDGERVELISSVGREFPQGMLWGKARGNGDPEAVARAEWADSLGRGEAGGEASASGLPDSDSNAGDDKQEEEAEEGEDEEQDIPQPEQVAPQDLQAVMFHEIGVKAPFPYIEVALSVRGPGAKLLLPTEVTEEETAIVREAIADAMGLELGGVFDDSAVDGQDGAERVVVDVIRHLDCDSAFACDDMGRRRRRLLSVEEVAQGQGEDEGSRNVQRLKQALVAAEEEEREEEDRLDQDEVSDAEPTTSKSVVVEVDLHVYARDDEQLPDLASRLVDAIQSGELEAAMADEGLDVTVGVHRSVRGFTNKHVCAVGCLAECGAWPMPPCSPKIMVDGHLVGPTSGHTSTVAASVRLVVLDAATAGEVDAHQAIITYTIDGQSWPTCHVGTAYVAPFVVEETTTIRAGVCMVQHSSEEGGYSAEAAEATVVVVPREEEEEGPQGRIASDYSVLWRSDDGSMLRLDAPTAVFLPGPSQIMVKWASGKQAAAYPYASVEAVPENDQGPAGVVIKASSHTFPPQALNGKARPNANDGSEGKYGPPTQETARLLMVTLPDGSRHEVLRDAVRVLPTDGKDHEVAQVRLGRGYEVQVPLADVNPVKEGYPWDVYSTYSKQPLTDVAVDRWPSPPDTPNQATKTGEGGVQFAHGAYERQPGMYGEFPVVSRSFDGSQIRIKAPADAFKHGPSAIVIEESNGRKATYEYTSKKPVGDSKSNSGEVELAAQTYFPPDVVGAWAEENNRWPKGGPAASGDVDWDHAGQLEKSGINVGSTSKPWDDHLVKGGRPGTVPLTPPDGAKAKDQPRHPPISILSLMKKKAQHHRAVHVRQGARAIPNVETSRWPWDAEGKQGAAASKEGRRRLERLLRERQSGKGHGRSDVFMEAAQQSAKVADELRASAASSAERLQEKLKALEKRMRALQLEKKEKMRKLAAGHLSGEKKEALHEEKEPTYEVGGQEAFVGDVGAWQRKFAVLEVSKDERTVTVSAPNEGHFPVGPSQLVIETADGAEGTFAYQTVQTKTSSEEGSEDDAGLVFVAPPQTRFPLNAAYAFAAPHSFLYPILHRSDDGLQIQVLAPNDGTFAEGPAELAVRGQGGHQLVYRYSSMQWGSTYAGDTLTFFALNCTFPASGAFVSAANPRAYVHHVAYPVWWESSDGSKMRVQALNDGSFAPGPARIRVHVRDGGVGHFTYARADLGQASSFDLRPGGLLLTARPGLPFPPDAVSVEPLKPLEPYPVVSRSEGGKSVVVLGGREMVGLPGGKLRVRLADGMELGMPFEHATPARHDQVQITAPDGVRFPAGTSFVGLVPPFTNSAEAVVAQPPPTAAHSSSEARSCSGSASVEPPVVVSMLVSTGSKVGALSHACPGESVYVDDSVRLIQVPKALQGNALIQTVDADVAMGDVEAMSFTVSSPSLIYLLWDKHGTPEGGGDVPSWVRSEFLTSGTSVTTSAGEMEVLVSKQPASDIVRLGGCSAPPSFGSRRNYAVVVVSAAAAKAWSPEVGQWTQTGAGDHQASRGRAKETAASTDGIDAATWLQPSSPQTKLRVSYQSITGREMRVSLGSEGALPLRGRLIVARVRPEPTSDHAGAAWAHVGEVLWYEAVAPIVRGEVGFPGVAVTARAGTLFPPGVVAVGLLTDAVLAVRPGGMQMQLQLGPPDEWTAGPELVTVTTHDGQKTRMWYESAAFLPANANPHRATGGLLLTAPVGHAFPTDAASVEPSQSAHETAAEAAAAFPVLGNTVSRMDQGRSEVVWESADRTKVRVRAPPGVGFPEGGAVVWVQADGGREERVPYKQAAWVETDTDGPEGWMLSLACCGLSFPAHAKFVIPDGHLVAAVRSDGFQLQVVARLRDFEPGPGVVSLVLSKARTSPDLQMRFETVAALPGENGVLLTAQKGERFPTDAAMVRTTATAPEHTEAEEDEEPSARQGTNSAGSAGAVVVSDATADNALPVEVRIADDGVRMYSDEDWRLGGLPWWLRGLVMVSPSAQAASLSFRVSSRSHVVVLWPHVTHQRGEGRLPWWLESGFEQAPGMASLEVEGGRVDVEIFRSKEVVQGKVQLGGSGRDRGRDGERSFVVLLQPAIDVSEGGTDAVSEETAGHAKHREDDAGSEPEHGAEGRHEQEGAMVAEVSNVRHRCGGESQTRQCLQAISACLAPYRLGDPYSCHCFQYQHSEQAQAVDSWLGESWCSGECVAAIRLEYDARVQSERGHKLQCA